MKTDTSGNRDDHTRALVSSIRQSLIAQVNNSADWQTLLCVCHLTHLGESMHRKPHTAKHTRATERLPIAAAQVAPLLMQPTRTRTDFSLLGDDVEFVAEMLRIAANDLDVCASAVEQRWSGAPLGERFRMLAERARELIAEIEAR